MLQNLHVKNLALINETEVDFKEGLNILSGETGAGKSIIIGSINLALGEKVQKEMLRENADYALVELIFSVTDPRQKELLKELDVIPENDQIILSRKIVNGRGVAKVNSESVPVSKMKAIASVLIDIHGQHEHQSLLSKRKHLEILDDYAKEELADWKQKVRASYQEYRRIEEELAHADVNEEERLRELSFLEYEVREIEEAGLEIGEDETLEANYRKFSNGKKIMEAVNGAYLLTGSQDDSASELIGRAVRELGAGAAYDEQVKSLEEQLLQIDSLVNDFNREIAEYIDETEFDDETFYQMEKRLDEINHLKSKYGNSIASVLEAAEEKRER